MTLMMYFQLHPIKVVLLDMGQVPKKVKYIRILGENIQDCYASFSDNIRAIVNQEAMGTEFFCLWMDYANDEIELRNIDDFWIWIKFLETHTMFRPEILIRPVFLMPPPMPQPMPRFPFIPMTMNRPQFPPHHQIMPQRLFSANAPSFYPARFQGDVPQQMQNHAVEVNVAPPVDRPHPNQQQQHHNHVVNGRQEPPRGQLDGNLSSSCESIDGHNKLSPPIRDQDFLLKQCKDIFVENNPFLLIFYSF